MSITTATLQHWPARLVPPPRDRMGAPNRGTRRSSPAHRLCGAGSRPPSAPGGSSSHRWRKARGCRDRSGPRRRPGRAACRASASRSGAATRGAGRGFTRAIGTTSGASTWRSFRSGTAVDSHAEHKVVPAMSIGSAPATAADLATARRAAQLSWHVSADRPDSAGPRDRHHSGSQPTSFPPTAPNPTARSSGTRPPPSSSRSTAGGVTGLGYTYADRATATAVRDALAPVVTGQDAFATAAALRRGWSGGVRNVGPRRHRVDGDLGGRRGAVGSEGAPAGRAAGGALWDGRVARSRSTAAADSRRTASTACSASWGMGGRRHEVREDEGRARPGRRRRTACGPRAPRSATGVELFVDANGAYSRKQALALAARFADAGVTWFEEPVSSDDLDGLRLVRDGVRRAMDVAAGEYGYDPFYFRRMLAAGAVDVLQADAHALRRRDRLLGGARAGRRARLAAVRALRAGPARPARLRADPRCATLNTSTTTSGSKGCCSTARQCHRTARWRPIRPPRAGPRR